MSPDDFEPQSFTYREWEGEVTVDGVDYLVIGTPTVERSPETKPDGRLGEHREHWFEDIEVYPALGDTYDYDHPLRGGALADWRKAHEATIAERACDEQQAKAEREREERMYGE